jgi:nitric oxide reductase subunit B
VRPRARAAPGQARPSPPRAEVHCPSADKQRGRSEGTKLLAACFWSLNLGLALMALMTLLPIGTLQLFAAIDNGYWYARSAEFMQQPIIEWLVWMRVPGDTLFSIGALLLAWFVLSLWWRPRRAEAITIDSTQSAQAD